MPQAATGAKLNKPIDGMYFAQQTFSLAQQTNPAELIARALRHSTGESQAGTTRSDASTDSGNCQSITALPRCCR